MDERHRGACKNLSNNVEAFNEEGESLALFSKRHRRSTRRRMEELLAWLDEQGREKRPHPLLVVAIFVVVFLEIHPFQDGNGRLSRILTTLMLLRAGYAYVPYSSLESIVEHSKESYYISLRRTQGTIRNPEPDWNPWIEFFLEPCIGRRPNLRRKWSASASSSRTCRNYPSHCLSWRASMGELRSRRLPGSQMRAVTLSRITSRHSSIKGTSYSTVRAAVLGTVFPD